MPLYNSSRTWYVLGASGVGASHTGDTNETVLATITIPAGAMGANGILRLSSVWATPGGSGNTKTLRARLGGLAGTIVFTTAVTTTLSYNDVPRQIQNRNSQSSQIMRNTGSPGGGTSGGAPSTAAIDTSASTTLVFTAQLANTGETITLESYIVELLFAA